MCNYVGARVFSRNDRFKILILWRKSLGDIEVHQFDIACLRVIKNIVWLQISMADSFLVAVLHGGDNLLEYLLHNPFFDKRILASDAKGIVLDGFSLNQLHNHIQSSLVKVMYAIIHLDHQGMLQTFEDLILILGGLDIFRVIIPYNFDCPRLLQDFVLTFLDDTAASFAKSLHFFVGFLESILVFLLLLGHDFKI